MVALHCRNLEASILPYIGLEMEAGLEAGYSENGSSGQSIPCGRGQAFIEGSVGLDAFVSMSGSAVRDFQHRQVLLPGQNYRDEKVVGCKPMNPNDFPEIPTRSGTASTSRTPSSSPSLSSTPTSSATPSLSPSPSNAPPYLLGSAYVKSYEQAKPGMLPYAVALTTATYDAVGAAYNPSPIPVDSFNASFFFHVATVIRAPSTVRTFAGSSVRGLTFTLQNNGFYPGGAARGAFLLGSRLDGLGAGGEWQ